IRLKIGSFPAFSQPVRGQADDYFTKSRCGSARGGLPVLGKGLLGLGGVRAHGGGDLVRLEAAVLQEAHLPGLLREVGGRVGAEAAGPDAARQRPPVLAAVRERLLHDGRVDAALLELEPDADRSLPLADARLDKALGEAGVVLQPLRGQALDGLARGIRVEAAPDELGRELGPAVLAPGQAVHSLHPRGLAVAAPLDLAGRRIRPGIGRCDHASFATGSASFVSLAVCGSSACRIRRSISAAISGLAFRNSRAFSLPWPIRSLP